MLPGIHNITLSCARFLAEVVESDMHKIMTILRTLLSFCVLLALNLVSLSFSVAASAEDDGGWFTDPASRIAQPGPCNIDVKDASLTQEEFLENYAYKAPVIIKRSADNMIFEKMCNKENMMEKHGNKIIRLSTANTHSYKKVDVSLTEYIEKYLKPQTLNCFGNETMYWFGDNNYEEWGELFNAYAPPPYRLPKLTGAYSFGVAGAGTGVPFHFHGPGFGEVIYGRKRWFLYPHDREPLFNGDISNLQWVIENYPKLTAYETPWECTIGPGEFIYFPDRWWHATLNIDTSVFISTFLG